MRKLIIYFFIFQCFGLSAQMFQISNFGTNPGNLSMYLYEPTDPKPDAGTVLVLHGCLQNATDFSVQTGWNILAEKYGFYVIYAEQKGINNPTRCFNWFRGGDNVRDEGEAKSMREMIAYVHDNYAVDVTKNYVCGLSAGGSMTPVLMACYPEVIKSGGTWAGVPYLTQSIGSELLTPTEWGDKVRNAFPSYEGTYPTLFVCQGTQDGVTEPINESRLVAQWTNVHNSDQTADEINYNFEGNPNVLEKTYTNASNDTILKSYTIEGMEHGIAVDPGSGISQGGVIAPGAYDVDFYSTYWMAKFFGLLEDDILNSIPTLINSDIKVLALDDGSLKIINNSDHRNLEVIAFDLLGRSILKKDLSYETYLSPAQLNQERIIAISIINQEQQLIFSELHIRY